MARDRDMEVRTWGKPRLEMEFKVRSVREWNWDVSQRGKQKEAEGRRAMVTAVLEKSRTGKAEVIGVKRRELLVKDAGVMSISPTPLSTPRPRKRYQ